MHVWKYGDQVTLNFKHSAYYKVVLTLKYFYEVGHVGW